MEPRGKPEAQRPAGESETEKGLGQRELSVESIGCGSWVLLSRRLTCCGGSRGLLSRFGGPPLKPAALQERVLSLRSDHGWLAHLAVLAF